MPIERSSTPLQNPYNDPSMMESEADKSFSQSTMQQTSMKRLNTNDSAIAQREREINDIAQGIIELADIFKELQGMVIDQGTMLDRVDYNIENMAVNVKAADKELNVVRIAKRADTRSIIDQRSAGDGLSAQIHKTEDHVLPLTLCYWYDYTPYRQTKEVTGACKIASSTRK